MRAMRSALQAATVRRIHAVLLAIMFLVAAGGAAAQHVPLYRLNNGTDHFFTTNEQERSTALAAGWNDEGVCCHVASAQTSNTIPLYRLYNGADHFYTANEQERNTALAAGWKDEGICCHVMGSQLPNTVPLFRLYNGKDHFYTVNEEERNAALAAGWNDEGISSYVWSVPAGSIATRADVDSDGIPDEVEAELLARYSPVLLFSRDGHADEPYRPTDVRYYLDRSELMTADDAEGGDPRVTLKALRNDPLMLLGSPIPSLGSSDIYQNPRKSGYRINPITNVSGESEENPGRHGNPWSEVLTRRNVGLYGHVVPVTLTSPDSYDYSHVPNSADVGTLYYKVEFWQFFGYNDAGAGAAGEHEGDWTTVQLIVDSSTLRPLLILNYVHTAEIRFTMGRAVRQTPLEGGTVMEYIGPGCCDDAVDAYANERGAQQQRVRLARDSRTGEYTHPIVYVENSSHEFWPTEHLWWPAVHNHDGDAVTKSYAAAPPPNLGEVEHPMNNEISTLLVLRYNGAWGKYHDPPEGPPLHQQWTWPASSSISWRITR
jgi:hypothetical protein